MRVAVRLFALAKQRAGREQVLLDLPDGATVGDLRAALASDYPALAPLLPSAYIAIDNEYADNDRAISPDSEVAVIPPVSGG